jgi:hypothetical protein
MWQDIRAFFLDPAAFRKTLVGLLGVAGVLGAACSQQIAALVAPAHQGLVLALCAAFVSLAGIQAHNSGEKS